MTVELAQLPPLEWTGDPSSASYDAASATLTLTSAAGVDWSNGALGGEEHRASALAFAAPAQFTLSARVTVSGSRTTFDAGALAIWADRDHWAKLCFEFSPQGDAMVVSVVTNDFSDDVNSVIVTEPSIHLRVARIGPAWAFHSSRDGERWDFVRLFRLSATEHITVGFLAQSPQGDRCEARFDDIAFSESVPRDLRDGS